MPSGWYITVYRQADEGAEPSTAESLLGTRLAVWQSDASGLGWIEALVASGRARSLGGNGYPNLYTATAAELIPRVRKGPPRGRRVWSAGEHDVLGPGWLGRTVIDEAAIEQCRPEEWPVIEAWDES